MEVHAHNHTERKKFTHYLWEFLMLFLAVFSGFLAENQREHMVEHQREKQYIRSLVNDIKSDIKQLEKIDQDWSGNVDAADTAVKHLAGKEIYANSRLALYFVYGAMGFTDFISNDGTIQQLKNSGGMRLIRKSKIVDSIMAYQKTVDIATIHQAFMGDMMQSKNRVTDLFDMIHIINSKGNENIPLLTQDRKAINSAYTYILEWGGLCKLLKGIGNDIKECGKRLLKMIYEQYGIK